MNESAISELTHQLSFAVFRVASVVDHIFLRKELEKASIELASYLDEESLNKLDRLIHLGASIGEISDVNAQVLIRETNNLKDLLNDDGYDMQDNEEIDISSLFTSKGNQLPFAQQEETSTRKSNGKQGPSTRQKEILQFLRQFPSGCGFSDLARNFDEVSRRTIRNDISTLIDLNLVERVGKSGPHSYIRIRTDQEDSSESRRTTNFNTDNIIFLDSPKT